MADRLEWFAVTIPAGTAIASPVVVPCVFNTGDVTKINVKVPPGPQGNVGFFIGAGGSQYVPRTPGSFIMPDNDYFQWDMQNAISSGSWSVTAYNTDIFPHTIQVSFEVNENPAITSPVPSGIGTSSSALPDSVTTALPAVLPTVDPLSADFLIANAPGTEQALLAELSA